MERGGDLRLGTSAEFLYHTAEGADDIGQKAVDRKEQPRNILSLPKVQGDEGTFPNISFESFKFGRRWN